MRQARIKSHQPGITPSIACSSSCGLPPVSDRRSEDKISVQLRQLFRADVNALTIGDPLNQRRKAEPGVAQHPAQRMIRMMHRDLAVVRPITETLYCGGLTIAFSCLICS